MKTSFVCCLMLCSIIGFAQENESESKFRRWTFGIDYVDVLRPLKWNKNASYLEDIVDRSSPAFWVQYNINTKWTVQAKGHQFTQFADPKVDINGAYEYSEAMPYLRMSTHLDLVCGYNWASYLLPERMKDDLGIWTYLGARIYSEIVRANDIYMAAEFTTSYFAHAVWITSSMAPGYFNARPVAQLAVQYRFWRGALLNGGASYCYNGKNLNPTMLYLGVAYSF